jgi:hypothetical protein
VVLISGKSRCLRNEEMEAFARRSVTDMQYDYVRIHRSALWAESVQETGVRPRGYRQSAELTCPLFPLYFL